MYVRELTRISYFQPISILTGEAGMDRQMKDVVLLEYDSFHQSRPRYYEEDFLITTLFFVKDHPELLYTTIERLIDLGAAGLAFKSAYFDSMPQEVVDLAVSRDFSIIKFDGLYIEDVILSISDYMRLRQEFSRYEGALFKILQGMPDSSSVETLCASLNPNRQKFMNAVCIHAPDLDSDWSSQLRDDLQYRNSRRITADYRFLQFRRGFFVLCNSVDQPDLEAVGKNVMELLRELGCNPENLCFGVSSAYQRSTDFDCVIREAFDSMLFAITEGRRMVLFPDLKLYGAIFPMVRDKSTRETVRRLLDKVRDYDRGSTSGSLMDTLVVHAQQGYELARTAQAMGQHTNTIRYRLKKICELTATPRESPHALFLLGEFMRIDAISNQIF